MKPPTKAELQAENKQLAEEVAALRDLLAAIKEGDIPPAIHIRQHAACREEAARRFDRIMAAAGDYGPRIAREDAAKLRAKWAEPLPYTAACLRQVDGQTAELQLNNGPMTVPGRCWRPAGHDGDCLTLKQIRERAKSGPPPAAEVYASHRKGNSPGEDEPCPANNASTGEPCVLDASHVPGISHRDRYGFQWAAPQEGAGNSPDAYARALAADEDRGLAKGISAKAVIDDLAQAGKPAPVGSLDNDETRHRLDLTGRFDAETGARK